MEQRFETFTAAISTLYRCIQRIKAMEMTEFHLKGGHALCLFHLSRHPEGLTSAELSTLCEEDKAAVSRWIALLEERCLLCRLPPVSGGRNYRARLVLTPEGQQVAAAVNDRIRVAVERGGRGLSSSQRAMFYSTLTHIAQNLQEYCTEREEEL